MAVTAARVTTAARRLVRALLVGWFVLPLVPLLIWSAAGRWSFPDALPRSWGLGGLREAVANGAVDAAARSTLIGLAVAGLALPAGSLAARALVRLPVPAPRLVAALLLAPVALPPFAVAMGLDVALLRARVPGPVGVVLVLTVAALPYTVYVMRLAHGSQDPAVEEEARTLGAGPWAVWWRVRLPLLAPGLSAAAFLAFLVGWGDYVVTLLIGGGRLVTLPLLVGSAVAGTGNDGVVAVLALGALLPPLALLVLAGRLGRRAR